MAKVRSNSDDVSDWLDELVQDFNFNLPGKDASLGKDLVNAAAESMVLRSVEGKDPDGNPWRKNQDDYAKYKLRRYDVTKPGELGGQMLSHESMVGKPIIRDDHIDMVYGTGDKPADPARNGVALTRHEKQATDREKATYFTDGGRRFYEFDDSDAEAVMETAGEGFAEYLKERGAI